MDPADDDFRFEQALTLRDGRRVTIRVMRPDDRDRLVAAFARLDRESVYTRFFSYRRELPQRPLGRIGRIDFVQLAGLVATSGEGVDEVVIGSATYVATGSADGAKAAEVAFLVEEDFQGQGLAGRLLDALAGIARRHGFARFEAEVLARNRAMLAVFERGGLPLATRREGEVIHLSLSLGAAA